MEPMLQDSPILIIGLSALFLVFILICGIIIAFHYAETHREKYQRIQSLLYYTIDSINREYINDEVIAKHDVVKIVTSIYNGNDLDIPAIRQQSRRREFMREQK